MKLSEVFAAKVSDERARYVVVGAINTVFGFSLFTVVYLLFKDRISYIAIFIFCQTAGVIFSHSTQRNFVWYSETLYRKEVTKFAFTYLVISILNIVLLAVAVDTFKLDVLASQYAIALGLLCLTYLVQKRWVFRRSTSD